MVKSFTALNLAIQRDCSGAIELKSDSKRIALEVKVHPKRRRLSYPNTVIFGQKIVGSSPCPYKSLSVHYKLPNTVAVMDVFIPEEYVIMRRMEKKTGGIGGKSRNMVAVEASKKLGKENMAQQLPPTYRVESKELLIPDGITETVVFCCLSA
ncbi:hypothetical protein Golob_013738 [Gossypium lobatum]|uniref:Uncharacterized protein n=1 Tax=Gossypium lobatum TaxID=34289 RepID=A0A7J8LQB8_9ROSI|nr:hypothetical protein [Gossypium lobatum]